MVNNKPTLNNLYAYVQKTRKKALLEAELQQIEAKLSKYDKLLEDCDKLELKNLATWISLEYNNLNLKRIKLSLKLNKLEEELLLFELEAATRD